MSARSMIAFWFLAALASAAVSDSRAATSRAKAGSTAADLSARPQLVRLAPKDITALSLPWPKAATSDATSNR